MNKKKEIEKMQKMQKMLNYSLSDSDIKSVLGDFAKIIKYSDLDRYKSLNELLPYNNDFVVILIESEHNSGHWTCITRRDNVFSLFDSYGCKLSDELDFISKSMNYLLGNTKKEMENLIKNTDDDCEVVYNKERLQSKSSTVATCGRWCCAYLSMFKMGYSLEEFLEYINKRCKESGLPPDVVVTKLIPIYH
jgi:hypothetical protein